METFLKTLYPEEWVKVNTLTFKKVITPYLKIESSRSYSSLISFVRYLGHIKNSDTLSLNRVDAFWCETGYALKVCSGNFILLNSFYESDVLNLGGRVYTKKEDHYTYLQNQNLSDSKIKEHDKIVKKILGEFFPMDIVNHILGFIGFDVVMKETGLKVGRFKYYRSGFTWYLKEPRFITSLDKLVFGVLIPEHALWEKKISSSKLKGLMNFYEVDTLGGHAQLLFDETDNHVFRSIEDIQKSYM